MKQCKPIEYTKCLVCLKDINDKEIEIHMKTHDGNHKCEECDTTFSSKKALSFHNYNVHKPKLLLGVFNFYVTIVSANRCLSMKT